MTGQRRHWSLFETVVSTAIGFTIALLTQLLIFPWFGLHPSFSSNLLITAIFTFVSIVRGYFVRRLFNWIEHGRNH